MKTSIDEIDHDRSASSALQFKEPDFYRKGSVANKFPSARFLSERLLKTYLYYLVIWG